MPFTFLFIGAVLVVSGVRGTSGDLWNLLKNDIEGKPSFLPWIASILAIGSLGYIESVRTFSRAFLVLVIVVLFLKNKGFFSQLKQGAPEIFGGSPNTGATA